MTDSARHRSSTVRPARLDIPPQGPAATRPTPTQHTARIRAHLAHLLPRHAVFCLSLTVHQLNNVPLVHGEFGLKWKIKGVTSHSGNGILDKVKVKANIRHRCTSAASTPGPPSMAKGSDTDNASLFDAVSDAHSVANSSSNDHAHSVAGHSMRTQPVSVPVVVVSANYPSSSSMARSVSGTSSIASVGSMPSPVPSSGFIHDPLVYLSSDWPGQAYQSPTPTHDRETLPNGDTSAKLRYSPAKGITPYVKLKEHSVVWERTLKFVVQMSVGRDTRELGDCLAKFVVMQRVIPGDPDAPRNPRLGAVYINLAQYVSAGTVTRRYLLRQSKTNATLKLTIRLEHTAGEVAYVAPPLPKDEILSGVAGILESSDVYRTRPRASDLYASGPCDSSSDDAETASGSEASSVVSGSAVSHRGSAHAYGHYRGRVMATTVGKQRRPFEVSKLPSINDPRGTEKLIEALFNPVPVTQPSQLSPFTYLVEVDGEGEGEGDANDDDGHGSYKGARHGTQGGSGVDEADEDGSVSYCDDDEDGARSDYHSLRSHASVRGSLRSKRSARSLASKAEPAAAVSTGVGVQHEGATERRTWWQKVLRSPNTSG